MNWTGLNQEERDLVRAGRVIEAIKSMRARLYCGLKEAKDACDLYRNVIGTGNGTVVSSCSHVNTMMRVNSERQDSVVCTACGAIYTRA